MSDTVRVALIAAVATILAAAIGAWAVVASGAVEVTVSSSEDDGDERSTTVTSLQERVDELESENETLTSERDAAEAETASASGDPESAGPGPDGGASDDPSALYSEEQLSIVLSSECRRGVDLGEPRVLPHTAADVTVGYAECSSPNDLVLAKYGAEAVSPADAGVGATDCADAVRRAGADSVGIAADSSYCVDLGVSPVTDTLRRVVRLDVTAIDATTVTIVATAWDV
jgi:outer membrane murein-binding lipoprotein Lpp